MSVPTAFGALTVATYQVCFFAGVARTGVAVGTIVGIGSAPIMSGVLDWVVRREPPGGRWLVSTVLAIIGCSLLVLSGSEIGVDPLGILLAIGAGASYAVYALASKYLLEDHPPDAAMAVIFSLGALLLTPLLLMTPGLDWVAQPRGILVILHLGIISVTLSYVLFAQGLLTTAPATAVTLSLAEPLTAGLLGVIVLGERLTAPALVGIGLLFGGLYLLTRRN